MGGAKGERGKRFEEVETIDCMETFRREEESSCQRLKN